MRPDVYAVAVTRGFISGTWSGDLLFNTRANLAHTDEIFRVALHEAGHVFGLEHNQDPSSVMYETGLPTVTQPSANDLDEIWAQFGQRSPDINEIDSDNDTPDRATQIHYSSGYLGQTPLISHADIGAGDLDVYRFDTFDNGTLTGTVTFDVRTDGLSQLQPRVRVFPEGSNQPLPDSDPNDGYFSAQLPDGARYYVYVDKAATGLTAIGGYALVATFDDYLVTTAAAVDRFAGPDYRFLDQRQIEDIFAGDPEGVIPFFDDDLHLNDTLLTATELAVPPGFIEGTKYQALASISDAVDVDYYQLRSANFGPGAPNVMSVLVENVEGSDAQFEITVLGESGQVLPQTSLINHGGRVLIQLQNVQPDANHFVRIAAKNGETGNYRLSVISGTKAESIEAWVSDTVPAETIAREYVYHAPRTELTMFAFRGVDTNSSSQSVRVSVTTLAGTPVLEIVGAANSFTSADSVMLRGGVYRVTVEKMDEYSTALDFDLNNFVITDPLAVPKLDLTNTPVFTVAGFDDVFVFPGGGGNGGSNGQSGGNLSGSGGVPTGDLAPPAMSTPLMGHPSSRAGRMTKSLDNPLCWPLKMATWPMRPTNVAMAKSIYPDG